MLVTGDSRPVVWGDDQQEQTIRFWDLESGKELGSLTGHGVNVESLAFSPDGRSIVSGLQDATALVWDVPKEVLPHLLRK